jgi:hypothetical protein
MKLCVFENDPNREGWLLCSVCGRQYRPTGPAPWRANCGRWNPVNRTGDPQQVEVTVTFEGKAPPPRVAVAIERKPLTLSQKAVSLAGSLAALAVDVLRNGADAFVTNEQLKERASICNDCPEISDSGRRCEVCGCQLWAKQRAKVFACPHGKWPAAV